MKLDNGGKKGKSVMKLLHINVSGKHAWLNSDDAVIGSEQN